ncbi:hypothetical protein EJ07DRAFT_178654 [Lizonia empirigonia]|nr:hypothetical protein EJ07DRAFT_178654 [Lizonia empirigonia]
MKASTLFTTFFAAMATASPALTSTRADAMAGELLAPTKVPLCTFDVVKGEYVCPPTATGGAAMHVDATSPDRSAADCAKCKRDWDECMKHWGCWFYDCNGPCKCDVGRKDPSCTECEFGKCY